MKKFTKNLFAGIGMITVGFVVYTLCENYIQNEIRQKEKADAEKRAEYIARRKAQAKAKREAAVAENAENSQPTESADPKCREPQAESPDFIADEQDFSKTI